jgi:hypothetical protein
MVRYAEVTVNVAPMLVTTRSDQIRVSSAAKLCQQAHMARPPVFEPQLGRAHMPYMMSVGRVILCLQVARADLTT